MKLHYAFPAAAAMAVHAIFLLGFTGRPPVALSAPKEKTIILPFTLPLEEKEKEIAPEDKSTSKKGTTDLSAPISKEPIVVDIPPDAMITPATTQVDYATIDTSKLNIGVVGIPEGVDGANSLNKVPIYGPGVLDHKPATRLQISPVYPALAKAQGLTGEVLVAFTVDEKGRVISPRVVSSTDRMFEEPTLAAVSKWRFEPGRKDGRVVRFKMAVPVTFRLNGT